MQVPIGSRIIEFWDLWKTLLLKLPSPPQKASSIQVGNGELWLNLTQISITQSVKFFSQANCIT